MDLQLKSIGKMESRKKSNIQKAKMFLDKAYKAENELNTALSQIAIILQNYTSVEIHGDWGNIRSSYNFMG